MAVPRLVLCFIIVNIIIKINDLFCFTNRQQGPSKSNQDVHMGAAL